MLLGDFNIDFGKRQHPAQTRLSTMLNDMGLRQLRKAPTRVTNTIKSIIDLIFTYIASKLVAKSGVIDVSISNHMPIYMCRKAEPHKPEKTIINKRDYRLYIYIYFFFFIFFFFWGGGHFYVSWVNNLAASLPFFVVPQHTSR